MIKDHPLTRVLFNALNAERARRRGETPTKPLPLTPSRPEGPAEAMKSHRERNR